MSDFYQEMADTALELLVEFGQPVTLRRVTPGQIDPVEGSQTPDTVIEFPGTALLQDYNLIERGQSNRDGALIEQGDKKIILAASGLSQRPELQDLLIDTNGRIWLIANIKEKSPAGTPIIYELQGRRA